MKKALRKKFILFAMSAVTILLVVLVGAINGASWIMLDKQSDTILHTISNDDKAHQKNVHNANSLMPPANMDTVKSARFFMVCTDSDGNIKNVNIDQISSVTLEQATQYASRISDDTGKIDRYKYISKQLGTDHLIFFLDTYNQTQTFFMVLSISSAIAVISWIAVFVFVTLLSEKVVRPILAGMEKQKQFITNAGHELKTPLAIIQSNNDASTLINGETKYSKNIRQQTQRLNVLMTNLLTLAKMDEDIDLPVESVNISQILLSMLTTYDADAVQKQLTVTSDIQSDIYLQIHRDTFSQMLSILLDNAFKYTPNGGTVHFSAHSSANQVEITETNTCDSPLNIDPERLFDRFYRGDSARTQNSNISGYGIGLSAARAIAETFGGKLTAEYISSDQIRFTARF